MDNNELDILLTECLEKVLLNERLSPDPSELPLPNFNKQLTIIVSDDIWSNKLIEDLTKLGKINTLPLGASTFKISYDRYLYPDLDVIGFPTVYCRKTKTSHLGYTNYNELKKFFKLS